MSEEVKDGVVKETTEVKQLGFSDMIGSQEYINHMNAEKSKWAEDFRSKETTSMRETLRDEITKELNPEETTDQKRIRELEQIVKDDQAFKSLNTTKETLRGRAKEIGFDVSKADRYAAYGDKAEEYMTADHEFMTTSINNGIDAKIKGSFSKDQPPKGKEEDSYDFNARMRESTNKIK